MKTLRLFHAAGFMLFVSFRIYAQEDNLKQDYLLLHPVAKQGNFQPLHTQDDTYRKKEILKEAWNGNAWITDEKSLCEYDESGNQVFYITQAWDGSGWVDSLMLLYEYENNMNTTYSSVYWNGSQWLNSYRYIYTYDSYGNTLTSMFQNGDSITWINNSYTTYFRNSANHLIDSLNYQVWDGAAWHDYLKEIRFYNSLQMDSLWINYLISGDAWQYNGKYEMDYQAWPSSYTMTYLKREGDAWKNFYRYLYFYDERGNYTGTTYQNWIDDTWKNSMRYLYEYDQYNNNTYTWYQLYIPPYGWTIITESDYEYDENNLRIHRIDKSWHGDESVDSLRWTYAYELIPGPSKTKDASLQASFRVAPNPVSHKAGIHFMIDRGSRVKISLCDISGRRIAGVLDDPMPAGEYTIEFPLGNCDPGIYLVHFMAGSCVSTQKILIVGE